MALAPGLRSFERIVVADTDTAVAMGSGDVPVLGTPRLLALAEAVGTSAVLEHNRPSPLGAEVVVEAELTEVDGRRLVFRFTARHKRLPGSPDDRSLVVGTGTLERVIVDRDRFVSRAMRPLW
jgi:fluoroacetyl-CoA thioesterase